MDVDIRPWHCHAHGPWPMWTGLLGTVPQYRCQSDNRLINHEAISNFVYGVVRIYFPKDLSSQALYQG